MISQEESDTQTTRMLNGLKVPTIVSIVHNCQHTQ